MFCDIRNDHSTLSCEIIILYTGILPHFQLICSYVVS